MADSKREGIIDAFVTALAGTASVSTRIYRSRATALTKAQAPALVVRWNQDQFTGEWVSDKQERTLSILLDVYARGSKPDEIADPILVDAHSKIMANSSLRALVIDIYAGDTSFDMEQADGDAGFTTQQYLVKYRHKGTDFSSS